MLGSKDPPIKVLDVACDAPGQVLGIGPPHLHVYQLGVTNILELDNHHSLSEELKLYK